MLLLRLLVLSVLAFSVLGGATPAPSPSQSPIKIKACMEMDTSQVNIVYAVLAFVLAIFVISTLQCLMVTWNTCCRSVGSSHHVHLGSHPMH